MFVSHDVKLEKENMSKPTSLLEYNFLENFDVLMF